MIQVQNIPPEDDDTNGIDSATRMRFTLTSVAVITAIFLGSVLAYRMVTERILRIAMNSLTELSAHNERAMESLMEAKWDALEAIAAHIAMQKTSDTDTLLFRLSITKSFIDCQSLTMLADDGRTANANFVLGRDEALLKVCQEEDARFAKLMASPRAATQGRAMDMVYGVAIEPLTVDGVTYTHIACRTDMDNLSDGLKLDCYDGQGQVRVIDTDGSYIVKADRNRTPQEKDNFFTIVNSGRLPRGWDMARVRQLMKERKSFQMRWLAFEGDKCLLSFIPMHDTSWYFIMKAPVSVFMSQSRGLLRVVMVFMVASLIIVAAAMFMMFRRTVQMLLAEKEHRAALSRALDLADQASHAKTTFLNNMSHDMRTPMNAIIGYTALAASHVTNTERVRDYLSKIAQSSDHLLSLINDVLDMSRIEAGKVYIEEKAENLSDILHHLRNIILADIHSKSLDLFIDTVDVTEENIVCDRLHLTQILLNLMGNAMKFTRSGGTVSLRVTQKPGTRDNSAIYEFRVRDTGIGMNADFMGRVFEPFVRERNTTVSGIEGTGLGLSITKNLVEMMGGTIVLQSEEGKGSEFTVTLEFRLHGEGGKIEPIALLQGKRALVVDDDLDTCQSVAQMLRQMGMMPEWTMYGKEAVIRTEEAARLGDPFKVFMVDWLMPDMNGVEAARRIRRVAGSDAPIIILSAYDWADVEVEARDAGVTDFISKPLFAKELNAVLSRVCGTDGDNKEDKHTDGDVPDITASDTFAGERLLLVEDNELNREIAVEILKEAGFTVDSAVDGKNAVDIMALAKPGQYAAILMDVQMPVMDGYEATRRIRALADPLVAAVPIVALTANAFEEDRQDAFDCGMDAYVEKPISVRVLLKTLQQVLPNRDNKVDNTKGQVASRKGSNAQ